MVYLIIAKYLDEAERKRIEYAMERWAQVMKLGRPDGVPIIVEDDGEKIKELLDDLYARTSKDKVKIYNLSKASFDVEKTEKQIKAELEGGVETVEKFIGFILAKQKALFRHEIPFGKLYEVYTKKGRAEISTSLKGEDDRVVVDIRIKGFGDAPDLIYDKINSELKYFKEV